MSQIPPPQYAPEPVQGMHDVPDRANPIYLVLLAVAALVMVIALWKFNDNEENVTIVVESATATLVEAPPTGPGG